MFIDDLRILIFLSFFLFFFFFFFFECLCFLFFLLWVKISTEIKTQDHRYYEVTPPTLVQTACEVGFVLS